MHRQVNVVFLPQLLEPQDLDGTDVVVTDVLRASTTIVTALDRGALQVIPTAKIADAHELKKKLGKNAVLGGERGGVIIDGFDQGNSPLEFTHQVIGDRTLILCTTNGTVALSHCKPAARVLIGSFVNLSVVAELLMDAPTVTILCSGTDRRITSEDILFAGALVERLQMAAMSLKLSDQAFVALGYWRQVKSQLAHGHTLAEELSTGAGGRNLVKLGYHADIQFCAQIDAVPRLPQLDIQDWSIRLR